MKITKQQVLFAVKIIVLPTSLVLGWYGCQMAVKKYKEYKLKKSADKVFDETKNGESNELPEKK